MSELLLEPRVLSYMLQVLSNGTGGRKRVHDFINCFELLLPSLFLHPGRRNGVLSL